MIYSLIQTVAPSTEPVTLAEAKLWAKVDITDDDALIASLITAAREYIELIARRQFMTATYELGFDVFPFGYRDIRFFWNQYGIITIPRPPLVSVNSVVYVATDGNVTTLPTSEYQVDARSVPGRIAPAFSKVWPVLQYTTFTAVKIGFTCGYPSAASVPESLKVAIKMMVANCYRNRESSMESAMQELPSHFRSFIRSQGIGEYV